MKPTPGEKQLKAYALFEKAMSAAKKLGLPTHEAGWRAIHSVKEAEGIDLHDTLGFGPVGKLETFIDGRANPTMKALLTFYQDLKAGQVSFPKYPAFMDDERIYFSSTAIRQYLKVNHKMGTPHKINSELVSLGVVEEQDKERAYQGRRCAHLTIILRSQLDKLLP
ncbi:MAG: hypothetical protein ACR2PX_00945 [Endozoicomonas sp.]|uniref:hypothetical protein n=1 Tax=Endozoicomonas sp. TaxID=1892382 RepID=UPI003D9B156D